MVAVRIELLTGRYAASRYDDRTVAEWPPHPARLFSAMVAAWGDADDPDPRERDALVWFEALEPPLIAASDTAYRNPVTFFVPNNGAASTVVKDLGTSSLDLRDLEISLEEAQMAATAEPTNKKAQKEVARIVKRLDKLNQKIVVDSHKATAAKSDESDSLVRSGVQLLPDERGKQGRSFPVAIPHDPVVVFVWPDAEPSSDDRAALDGLLGRVARLGHSSSMVSCSLTDDVPPPTLEPGGAGERLRVTAAGLLDELEIAFATHQAIEPRVLPRVFATYRSATETPGPVPCSVFSEDWTVLADTEPSKLPLRRSLDLTKAVRGALLHHADDPLPEILSGHAPGTGETTGPSGGPHLAVVGLPFVGHRHADGNIRGVALVLPRSASLENRAVLARAVRNWCEADERDRAVVRMGAHGVRHLAVDDLSDPIHALRSVTWCRSSTLWGSVTPIALDRFPGGLWDPNRTKHERAERRAVDTIVRSCEHIGLPRPIDVDVTRSGLFVGVPDLRRFPPYESPGRRVRRMCVHAIVEFDQAVRGPLMIGAGRYFGYGLMRPVETMAATSSRLDRSSHAGPA